MTFDGGTAVWRRDAAARPLLVAAVAAAVLFAALAVVVSAHGLGPLPGDGRTHRFLMGHRPVWVVDVLRVVTATGTGVFPYVLAVAAGVLVAWPLAGAQLGWRPERRIVFVVAAWPAWLAIGQGLRHALMAAVERPRPPVGDWVGAHPSGMSFPSGHAGTSAMAAGLLVVALVLRRPRGAAGWIAVTLGWAAAVGVTRVWLGVHWASDVVGGWLLAAAWTCVGAVLARAFWGVSVDHGH
ncbi:phosphatase PAP2 family protein [Yinghuangia seranimata]|uniref:phosphatase PAP2 family protein n=1 Tax=Yinghuangia seranimata TaxID=408067 RepID=UPI00248CDD52|nr:phosphatase PAP2 family protein [Yinghuangia seranimata]MDI2131337.1 phosphatase PAP2 family protein [Yinghuangia seranimata]